jgi:hypothetical protein
MVIILYERAITVIIVVGILSAMLFNFRCLEVFLLALTEVGLLEQTCRTLS